MGWVGSGENFHALGWVGLGAKFLGLAWFSKSDPCTTLRGQNRAIKLQV